jgi:hypothetical protein
VKKDLKAGTIFNEDMILLKLIDDQIDAFSNVNDLIGKTLLHDMTEDSVIKIQNVI